MVIETHDFIRTYTPPSYDDPIDLVEDYERVKDYTARNPQQKSQAVSTALELPRERIRSWVDEDGMPDCYRGLLTALENDWIVDLRDDETAKAINCLGAWVLSSGGIDKNWRPSFVIDDENAEATLKEYARSANVKLQKYRSDDEDRSTELVPVKNASVLGRVLYTWTGVKGDKTEDKTEFPSYLRNSPEHICRSFAQVYVKQRGVYRNDRGEFIQINVHRDESFRKALKSCLQRAVSTENEIKGDGWPIRIYGDAIDQLNCYPEV